MYSNIIDTFENFLDKLIEKLPDKNLIRIEMYNEDDDCDPHSYAFRIIYNDRMIVIAELDTFFDTFSNKIYINKIFSVICNGDDLCKFVLYKPDKNEKMIDRYISELADFLINGNIPTERVL